MEPADRIETPDAIGRFRRWAAIAVGLATLGYLAYALWRGWSETTTELVGFDWPLYLPILGLTLINYSLRYLKWHYLLKQLGVHIPHRTNVWIFATGLGMAVSPGKAGEIVKPYLVRICSGTRITQTLPALIAERGTDGIAVVILAALGVTTFLAEYSGSVFGTIAAIAAVLMLLSVRPFVVGCLELLRPIPALGRITDRLLEAYEATRVCLAPAPFAVTMLLSLVAWFAECVGYWLVFRGLAHSVSLDVATFLYTFSTVFGAPSPGGVGMTDAALTELAPQIIEGFSRPQALAATLLIRVATLWFGVLIGVVALFRMEQVIATGSSDRGEVV